MRTPHPTPTDKPLPFERFRGGITDNLGAPAGFTEIALSGPAVAQFDDLVHELYPDAARVDKDRLQQLAAWLLSLPEDEARRELEARMQRMEELRALMADPSWDAHEAIRRRIDKLLAYVDRVDDLINDSLQLLGRLDDVLLIELAWPAFVEEDDEYQDFCGYRQTRRPAGTPTEQREAWLHDRPAELERLRRAPGGDVPVRLMRDQLERRTDGPAQRCGIIALHGEAAAFSVPSSAKVPITAWPPALTPRCSLSR